MLRWMMHAALAAGLLISPFSTGASRRAPQAQTAEEILASMTPEERVGQLFLVTFRGSDFRAGDPIEDLIVNGHISGVVLGAVNDNFRDTPNTLSGVRALAGKLQTAEYESSQGPGAVSAGEDLRAPVYVPLFIGISQEGEAGTYVPILNGLSAAPSQMALGATWRPSLAQASGEVMGAELADLGFNLILGPSLDVLEDPRLGGAGDLGTSTFGGDPYWVGEMGQAFIDGLHRGSRGRLAVVAKHFPGYGGSDRPLQDEVPTVRKSLEQLTQIELAPFFAVTGMSPGDDPSVTDALLTSHIRYQGFQGNIRATTRPVSLDPQALSQLMALETLAAWREGGGIMVSDSLGSRAVRRFRDPLESRFEAHLVARDAFLAGNDLLYLSNFIATGDPDELTTIKATLAFFAQKYQEDSLFAARVDASALRILRLKLRLYGGEFDLANVLPREGSLADIGSGSDVAFEVARRAATVLSPEAGVLEERLGGAPRLGERVVFFTDVRLHSQCSGCSSRPGIDVRSLENAVLRLYGPRAAGQVGGWNLASFKMADLAAYLGEAPTSVPQTPLAAAADVEQAIRAADWLVFSTLRSVPGVYGSNALKLLLDRRPDLARSKRIIVFAFDVPYDLDATDISKVDAIYALYAKSPPFIDMAARLLFQEIDAPGRPSVSVPGIGYDIIEAMLPGQQQVIKLTVQLTNAPQETGSSGRGYSVGDVLTIQTAVIVDANGNPVPDNTPVEFILSHEGIPPIVLASVTRAGVASAEFELELPRPLTIRAEAGPARVSEILSLNVQEGVQAFVTVIAPSPFPTATARATATPPSLTPTPPVTDDGEEPSPGRKDGRVGPMDLVLSLATAGAVGGIAYGSAGGRNGSRSRKARAALAGVTGALAGYNYLSLALPGSAALIAALGGMAAVMITLAGGGLGVLLVTQSHRLRDRP